MKEEISERIRKAVLNESASDYEIYGDMQVSLGLIKINSMDVYIYGAGEGIDGLIKWLHAEGIEVIGVLDRSISKIGKLCAGGVKIVEPESVELSDNSFVFVLTSFFVGLTCNDILNRLYKNGKPIIYHINEQDKDLFTSKSRGWLEFYKEHIDDLICVGKWLKDEESVDNFVEHIRCYCEYKCWGLSHISTRYKYFYGNEGEKLYRHLEDEVWLNCGSSTGDTIFSYFRQGLSAKRIIAVEGERLDCQRLKDNIALLPEKYRSVVDVHNTIISQDTDIDMILSGEKISFINADIEGAELGLLQTMENVIVRDRPVIAICVYHKKEDIIEIPKYINSITKNYEFKIRKYQSGINCVSLVHEMVLYAIPQERMI